MSREVLYSISAFEAFKLSSFGVVTLLSQDTTSDVGITITDVKWLTRLLKVAAYNECSNLRTYLSYDKRKDHFYLVAVSDN